MQPRRANIEVWPAPAKGLLRSGTLVSAPRDAAEVLDNFICTATGARLRGGALIYADVLAPIVSIMPYETGTGSALFAATDSAVFDISSPVMVPIFDASDTVDAGGYHGGAGVSEVGLSVPSSVAPRPLIDVPAIAGLTGGDWSFVQFSTSGGQFLIAVNGSDLMQVYNGTDWAPVTTEAVFDLEYENLSGFFTVGETVTSPPSTSAEIAGIYPTSDTTGVLRIIDVQDNFSAADVITGADGTADAVAAETAGSAIVVTGIATSALSFVWTHQARLWFVEGGTLSAWYQDPAAIGGALSEFPLDSVARLGGALLFGGTWSTDSGAGPDDYQLFVTTEGEVIVYGGTDPSSANTWALIGRYQIGKPLHKNAWFRAGGDFMVVTEDGIVSVGEALQRDRTALQTVAITAPIEDLWRDVVASRTVTSRFPVAIWPTRTFFIISVPSTDGTPVCLAANARTGAWSRITGWDVRALGLYQDQLYFGMPDGRICRADTGGTDLGEAFSGHYAPMFQDFGVPTDKFALHARALWKQSTPVSVRMTCFANYIVGEFPAPMPSQAAIQGKWGSGAKWGGGSKWGSQQSFRAGSEWQAVSGAGYSLSPGLVVQSAGSGRLDFEIVTVQLRFEAGRMI